MEEFIIPVKWIFNLRDSEKLGDSLKYTVQYMLYETMTIWQTSLDLFQIKN